MTAAGSLKRNRRSRQESIRPKKNDVVVRIWYTTMVISSRFRSETDVLTSLQDVRSQFPVLRDKTFFDSAGVGIAPLVAADAIRDFLDSVTRIPARSMVDHHMKLEEVRERARPEVARLINASEDEIALIESTTHGLSIAARALPLQPGDNIVTTDLEFIEVPLAWRQEGTGIHPEVRLARNQDGTLPVSAFEEHIDKRTRAVVVSSVQWCNGYRCDMEALGKLCERHGLLLIVDAIQQLGAFRLDASRQQGDIIVSGGHKWLGECPVRRGIPVRPPKHLGSAEGPGSRLHVDESSGRRLGTDVRIARKRNLAAPPDNSQRAAIRKRRHGELPGRSRFGRVASDDQRSRP